MFVVVCYQVSGICHHYWIAVWIFGMVFVLWKRFLLRFFGDRRRISVNFWSITEWFNLGWKVWWDNWRGSNLPAMERCLYSWVHFRDFVLLLILHLLLFLELILYQIRANLDQLRLLNFTNWYLAILFFRFFVLQLN